MRLAAAIAAAVVAVSALCVEPKRVDATAAHLTVRSDALVYVQMVERTADVPAPYRYRVAVPALARALRLPALDALRWITWVSTWLGFTLLTAAVRATGASDRASAAAILCIAAAGPQLYLFHNPYLTDGAGWLVLCALTYALVRGWSVAFAVVACVGVTVREATLFAVPAWLAVTGRRGRGVVAIIAAIAAWILLQRWVGLRAPVPRAYPFSLVRMIGDAAVAWHGLWILGGWGLFRLAAPYRQRTMVLGGLLVSGAIIASVQATDTTRMFLMVGPVLAFGLASTFDALAFIRSRAGALAVAACIATAVVWMPMRFATGNRLDGAWRPWRATALIVLALATVTCVRALRTGGLGERRGAGLF